MRNLAGDAEHQEMLARLRSILDRWIEETGDRGQDFESEAEYGADMAVYLRGDQGDQRQILERNIAATQAWRKARSEGSR